MPAYTSIDIIYNPNSTGPSRDSASELKAELAKLYPRLPVRMRPTEYAGHAEKIAYNCAKSSTHPLIISSSGDGGYNEVINGAIRAQAKGAKPICAVLAAGNANDHSRTVQERPLLEAIKKENTTNLDLLKATITTSRQSSTRYAHSYIGLGLTPVAAVELNKTDLNSLKELWIIIKTFYKYRPFKIRVDDQVLTLDSILFTNIGEMAKVLTVAKNAKPDDGLFEIVTFPHALKLRLLRHLAKAAFTGLEQKKQAQKYQFTSIKRMPAQFDGEVQVIGASAEVVITAEKKLLQTLL